MDYSLQMSHTKMTQLLDALLEHHGTPHDVDAEDVQRRVSNLMTRFKSNISGIEDQFTGMLERFKEGKLDQSDIKGLLESERKRILYVLEVTEEMNKFSENLFTEYNEILHGIKTEGHVKKAAVYRLDETLDCLVEYTAALSRVASSESAKVAFVINAVDGQLQQLVNNSREGRFTKIRRNLMMDISDASEYYYEASKGSASSSSSSPRQKRGSTHNSATMGNTRVSSVTVAKVDDTGEGDEESLAPDGPRLHHLSHFKRDPLAGYAMVLDMGVQTGPPRLQSSLMTQRLSSVHIHPVLRLAEDLNCDVNVVDYDDPALYGSPVSVRRNRQLSFQADSKFSELNLNQQGRGKKKTGKKRAKVQGSLRESPPTPTATATATTIATAPMGGSALREAPLAKSKSQLSGEHVEAVVSNSAVPPASAIPTAPLVTPDMLSDDVRDEGWGRLVAPELLDKVSESL